MQRLYFQCDPADAVANWPDERIWAELDARLATDDGWALHRGAIFQKGIIQMRSFVVEPMQFGALFLAGDAAHIVPPTGAKGLNLAVADVRVLAGALAEFYARGSREALARYSDVALERVWAAEHFSWWMTSMLHRFDDADPLQRRLQIAQLEQIARSRALQTALAESYVGRPLKGLAVARSEAFARRRRCRRTSARWPSDKLFATLVKQRFTPKEEPCRINRCAGWPRLALAAVPLRRKRRRR